MHAQAPEAERARQPELSAQQLAGFGASAFLAGVAGATVYLLRRRGLRHVDGVAAGMKGPGASVPHAAAAPPAQQPATAQQDVKGPLTLFREMNVAAFSRLRDPHAPRVASLAKAAPVEAAEPAAPAIGALRRGGAPSVPPPAPEVPAEDDGSDGAILAVRAFALATAIVASGAAAVVFGVRQALDVTTVAEFGDAMRRIMPTLGEPAAHVVGWLPSVPVPDADETAAEPLAAPLPLEAVGERLLATSDPIEWLRIARQQLDAELAAEQAARARH